MNAFISEGRRSDPPSFEVYDRATDLWPPRDAPLCRCP